jgi:hypothetical protein
MLSRRPAHPRATINAVTLATAATTASIIIAITVATTIATISTTINHIAIAVATATAVATAISIIPIATAMHTLRRPPSLVHGRTRFAVQHVDVGS